MAHRGVRRRLVFYLYPERNPLYGSVLSRFPQTRAQAVWRLLLCLGWREARDVITAYRDSETAVVRRWRRRFPLAGFGRTTVSVGEIPILDGTHQASPKARITIYLRPENVVHQELLSYYDSLAVPELRQMFGRVALVVGGAHPDLAGIIDVLR